MSTRTICLLSFAVAIAGCSSDTGSGGAKDLAMNNGGGDGATNGSDGGGNNPDLAMSNGRDGGGPRVPLNHRPNDEQCQQTAPPGSCQIQGAPGDCNKDADCTNGTNGRCIESNGGAINCHCSYDTCTHDSDCQGQTCACHGSAYLGAGNTCVPGNCHTDGDCPGSYCSPSFDTGSCGGLSGYYCHTAGDTCIDDTDCGNVGKVCAYSTTDKKWECAMRMFCP